jgi:crotonobetainyl-CoA:carnitine CoA-transferase CaiB-like acyl-CoA transferase
MGPLHGLRVVDLTDDLGRFATKLLAELGASVVRVHDGAGVTHGPAMRDPAAAARGGLLDWWYDAGKRLIPLALDGATGAEAYRRLARGADLIVESLAPGRLAALGLDHADLAAANPRLVQVSLTPFGRTGPRAHWVASDLVSAAMSGVLSVSGTPERAVVPWGRQSFAAAGIVAALTGLACVRAARRSGRGQLVDVSAQEAVASSVEQIWFQYHYADLQPPWPKIAPRQGSLHWSRGYLVLPAKRGACMITPTPAPQALLDWLIDEGVPGATEVIPPGETIATQHLPALVALAGKLALRHDAAWLFHEAQKRHLAWGQVQTVRDLEANEQLAFRGAFVSVPELPSVRRNRFPIVFSGTPAPAPAAPASASLDALLVEWGPREPLTAEPAAAPAARPLEGVRVLDFSWVLAGPFGCRMLGDLGADVVKLQTAARATGVNDPAQGFFATFNRSKRSVALDTKAPGALDVLRRLVERADVLIENFAAGVLARWGLTWDTLRAWNPRLVYVTMSGCGHEGPWNAVVSYGPTVQALCGLTALSNPPGRGDVGVGYALNDMAAGGLAALSVLAALEARERTGQGQLVDIAQLEVGAYLVGAAVLDLLSNGRAAEPTGNADPYARFLVDDVFATGDGELAVTVRDAADAEALRRATGGDASGLATWCAARSAADAMQTLQAAGVPAGRVQNAHHLFTDDPQLSARAFFATLGSPVFGERAFERFPALFGASALEPYRRAPAFVGEHNLDVLCGVCGLTEDEVGAAMADGRLA